ncbi:TRAP transporter small permease [Pusillimonas sp. MFBS29]|uniref:TRAP transporter small permease n=1 Tax=Pusillimonas sp. MFBS29 TaxID=2886690 RepID=UPI001D0FC8CC|nr:TRAP transporter small permease [Pusillimonas sp. MFBS29]MCC2594862.1 TRAP transporter small permease [Pusillimonas sp. MFBS29]
MQKRLYPLISEVVVIICFVAIVLATFLGVVSRYVLEYSLPWADEVARYALVWLVYIGMVSSLVRGQHVCVEQLLSKYQGKLRVWMLNLIDLSGMVLFGGLLYGGVLLMEMAQTQITPGLGISKSWVYAAIPIGAVLMLIEYISRIKRRLSGQDQA